MPPARQHNWTVIATVWGCVAVGLIVQVRSTFPPSMVPDWISWVTVQQAMRAVYWALLTPWIFRLRVRWSFRGPWRYAHLAGHAGLSIAAMAVFLALRVVVYQLMMPAGLMFQLSIWEVLSGFSERNLIDVAFYWGVLMAGWMIGQQQEQRARELREEQLLTVVAQAKLAALRQQLQPHFLFNALNSVSALVRDNEKDRAVDTLAQLSGFMRALMANSGQAELELSRELDYVQRYLAIEKVRFEERLQDRFEVGEDCLQARVPTLILQPLVENAIKHGLARRRSPGRLVISARREGDRLRLEVRNDPAEFLPGQAATVGQGLGLSTTRARLQKSYGETFTLDWELNGPDGTVVRMELPFIDARSSPKG